MADGHHTQTQWEGGIKCYGEKNNCPIEPEYWFLDSFTPWKTAVEG